MSMILTAYNVIKPLPPEGSDEWMAMLPGWSGWRYCHPNDHCGHSYHWSDWGYQAFVYWDIYEGKTGDVPVEAECPRVGDTLYYKVGSYYYFRGTYRTTLLGVKYYEIARATSLTPQR